MICSSQNQEFIEKILGMKAKDIKNMFKDEDEKYIISKQREITQNMPQHLKPNSTIEIKTTRILKNILHVYYTKQIEAAAAKLAMFPSTFHQKTKSHHWNLQPKQKQQNSQFFEGKGIFSALLKTIQGPKNGIEGEANELNENIIPAVKLPSTLIQKPQLQQDKDLKVQSIIKVTGQQSNLGQQKEKEPVPRDPQNIAIKSHQSGQEADNQSQVTFTHGRNPQQSINPFAQPVFQQQKHSPFISNKTNFLDLHTNKKPIQPNYMTPETYSMNMLQYAHNQKRQNTFADGYSYPNVIMGGSGTGWMKTAQQMRQNPFKKTFASGPKFEGFAEGQIKDRSVINEHKMNARMESQVNFRENVQDVLKYTLGDKRYTNNIIDRQNELATSVNFKSNMIQTAFQRPMPAKRQRLLENPFVRRPASTYKN